MSSVRSDLQLYERAMKQRWPIPHEYKEVMIKQLMRVIANPNSQRDLERAAKLLMAAEAQNQADEHDETRVDEQRNRFFEVAEQLGIGNSVGRISSRPADGSDTKSDWQQSSKG